ncbi:MAG: WD40 repeat domain-containing protein [Thermoleophilia bacterium]|nr:WD40 repeat domain-containing protein [Thermoleophilia bacterium]
MTIVDRRQVLEAFSRDLDRELHNFLTTDLGRFPTLVYQQLHNRLQWLDAPVEAEASIKKQAVRRFAPDNPPWIHVRSRPNESEALVRTYGGHAAWVTACAFSSDGHRVVSGGRDGDLRIWDTDSGRCVARLVGQPSCWTCVFTPDGRHVISGGWDGALTRWDAETGRKEATFKAHGRLVHACAMSADFRFVVSGDQNDALVLWSMPSGERVATLVTRGCLLHACIFSPDGRWIASSEHAGNKIWNTVTGECVSTPGQHDHRIYALAFSPDSRYLVLGGTDRVLRLWNIEAGEYVAAFEGHRDEVFAVAFSPDGRRIVSGGEDTTVRVWDVQTGQCEGIMHGHNLRIAACRFSPDGCKVVSASIDQTLKLWDISKQSSEARPEGHRSGVVICTFSLDGRSVVSVGENHTLALWDSDGRGQRATLELPHPTAGIPARWRGTRLDACAFCPGGCRVVLATEEKTPSGLNPGLGEQRLWLYDAETDECDAVVDTRSWHNMVLACAFSPDGHRVVSGSRDRVLTLWDAGSDACPVSDAGAFCDACTRAVSVNARWAASLGETLVPESAGRRSAPHRAETGKRRMTLEGHSGSVYAVSFSSNGRQIVSGGQDATARVWDVETGACQAILEGHENAVYCCVFSPDGHRVISGSGDRTVRLWDARTGACLAILEGHSDTVRTCLFSPDGSFAASGGDDRTLRLWDTVEGHEIARLITARCVSCIALHPGRPRLALGDNAGIVSVVDVHAPRWTGVRSRAEHPGQAYRPPIDSESPTDVEVSGR